MKRKLLLTLLAIISLLVFSIIYVFTYVPDLSEKHGGVDTELYLSSGELQPLVVAFGGGDGGNDWSRNYLKSKRDSLNDLGFAVLAVGYFKTQNTPDALDRISLNAIRDTIMAIASHPKLDPSKIVLMGGSKGGELALNLASRFDDFKGVIAMSASHVSFPALTWTANTSSWTFNGEEVTYVPAPFKTISPALKGDLFTAHSMMLEDMDAVNKARIKVENINGPILLLSGIDDDQWPSLAMSDEVMNRLKNNNFVHHYDHVKLDGGHIAPLENFNLVLNFLQEHFK